MAALRRQDFLFVIRVTFMATPRHDALLCVFAHIASMAMTEHHLVMLIRPLCRFVSMVTSGLAGVPPVFVHTASMAIAPLPVHALASFMSFRFHGCTEACCYIVCFLHVAPIFMTHHYMSTLTIPLYHLASMVTSWLAGVSPCLHSCCFDGHDASLL
jgi:hypothetical protein